MKRTFLFILPLLMGACSAPKYAYHFDHYDYNSGRKKSEVAIQSAPVINEPFFTASADEITPVEQHTPAKPIMTQSTIAAAKAKYNSLSREEKKSLKKEVKNELKKVSRAAKEKNVNAFSPAATSEMDNDLKLAIIFGAVGLVLSLFSGISAAFWVLGVIAIVVGVVFLVRWLLKQ